MLSKEKIAMCLDVMAEAFPNAQCELVHRNAFELLIAVILSAQATDVSVNKVTPILFEKYPTPTDFLTVSEEELMQDIQTIGLFRSKAKNIQKCCRQLIEQFAGQVPSDFDDLVSLAGVGPKTANVVQSVAFGIPALAVDTHVERVSKRLAMVPQNVSVSEVEALLKKKIAKKRWSSAHHLMIFWGRYHCTARAPKCPTCPLLAYCREGQNRV